MPLWVRGLLVAFLVLEFAGSAVSTYASELAGACFLVAFAALAVHLHQMPVAAWHAPEPAERELADVPLS